MPINIGEFICSGELNNSRKNGVFGWLEFSSNYGIRIELTGNSTGDLQGKDVRFRAASADALKRNSEDLPPQIRQLANRQIGVISEFSLQTSASAQAGQPDTQSLVIEWHSQDGHIMAELQAPEITFVKLPEKEAEADAEPADASDPPKMGVTEIYFSDEIEEYPESDDEADDDEDVLDEDDEEDEDEDPFGLFDESLGEKLASSLGPLPEDSQAREIAESLSDDHTNYPNWRDIEGLDANTRAMYEQWDEIFAGKKDEPLPYLFSEPMKLPKPEAVTSDEQAWPLVVAILSQLAKLSVALDVCEHFDAVSTYRLLMDEILANAKVHPNLAASEMVQHYSTSEHCRVCQADFDTAFNEQYSHNSDPLNGSSDDLPDEIPDDSSDDLPNDESPDA